MTQTESTSAAGKAPADAVQHHAGTPEALIA